jgi:diamine N-acetyltransferase
MIINLGEKCNSNDLYQIQLIGRATYEPYYGHVWQEDGMAWYVNHCFHTETVLHDLANPEIEYYLPKNEAGEIIGILKIWPKKAFPNSEITNALYLEKIYLMPAFFGKSIGKLLLEKVILMAKSLQKEAIWLYVMKTGPLNSYERVGFKISGEIDFKFEKLKPDERLGWTMILDFRG